MTPDVSIKNLSKVYKGKKGLMVEALKCISLDIIPGEVFGFLGPNGAGKSTTIKLLVGLIRATAGEATICGIHVSDPAARRFIGYLPENPALYDSLTGEEYLCFVARTFGINESCIYAEVDKALGLLDLKHAMKRQIRSYSKGMVQRLALAQAIVHDPDVYILDEPMSGLDPIGRAQVKDLIRNLKRAGKTVFFSTHITSDVEAVCDRVGVIVDGRLKALDTVENILYSGIEGYEIQLDGIPDLHEEGIKNMRSEAGMSLWYVPKAKFNIFLKRLSEHPSQIIDIETKRRDIESFFLDIVEKDKDKGNENS
jgi:ABC-2 type transport system ATP-binding protein